MVTMVIRFEFFFSKAQTWAVKVTPCRNCLPTFPPTSRHLGKRLALINDELRTDEVAGCQVYRCRRRRIIYQTSSRNKNQEWKGNEVLIPAVFPTTRSRKRRAVVVVPGPRKKNCIRFADSPTSSRIRRRPASISREGASKWRTTVCSTNFLFRIVRAPAMTRAIFFARTLLQNGVYFGF
jgi:hypothetical protein